ncbi:MAG: molybdenum ABC transporter ATP-binding protein [Rhizobiaceae bacterium]|nr:molybdenum ABC transporter ATP-binding protein [Rhizobiaceae bacterium]
MTISVDVQHRHESFEIDAQFESAGRLLAIFGPSGSGKTSLSNMISGLLNPNKGRIIVGGRTFVDTGRGIFVPPHLRRVGYVFQDGRLFPHLNVGQNLKFGEWFTPRAERYAQLDRVTDMLGIAHLMSRRPASLSGGEKQRVAIGRALLASPRLLVMDEPLASLDDPRKEQILPYIERLRDELKIPVVYVSHSIAEVSRLATDIVVLSAGRLTFAGQIADLMRRPDLLPIEERNESGAVLTATVQGHEHAYGVTILESPAGILQVPAVDAPPGTKLAIRIRARDVMVATKKPDGISALNILHGKIREIVPINPTQVEIDIECGSASLLSRITKQSVDALRLAHGLDVFAVVKTVSFDRTNITFGSAGET